MSDTITSEVPVKSEKKPRQRKPRLSELAEFKIWLEGLGFQSPPKIHLNGVEHPSAVMVVDFGTPLVEPVKLSSEQSAELIGFIRSVTKSLYSGEIIVRVQSDAITGIWWASVG